MTKYVCPECDNPMVQILEREPWDTKLDETKMMYQNPSKHYGYWCKTCKQMYKQKWEFILDE